jgi:hypothetical protein
VDFICSSCVQLLLGADQDDLRKAHSKAIEKGHPGKAKAIESFLIEDETNDRKTKITKRNLERKRPLRKVRPSRHQVRA